MNKDKKFGAGDEGLADDFHNFIDGEYGREQEGNNSGNAVKDLAELFEEISEWKLEAKLEDNARYFFHVNEVKKIEEGKRSFVIGRKGCGKTAISEYLCRRRTYNTFSVKLSFKNFPFNELYELKDTGYSGPHQYITLWKFLIYSHICQLMAQNEAIEPLIRERLYSAYIENQAPTLPRKINKWLDRDFGGEIFGVGLNIGGVPESEQRRASLIDRVNKLEDVILASIDDAKYLVVFDELDEDYRNITEGHQYQQYTALLTGLFKAVQDVRSVFSTSKLYPIVFLRDDIYEIVNDSDKTKWNDLMIPLDWNEERIKELIAFRISRAINPSGPVLQFNEAWHRLFFKTSVKIGNRGRKSVHSFDFIARSTHLRPRDFIQYLKSCCEEEIRRNHNMTKISPQVLKKVDESFSKYFKSELVDEIHSVIPDISNVMDVISQIRKWSFSVKEFIDAYNRQLKRSNLSERDPTFILKVLFVFSVVGNHQKSGVQIFRYQHHDASFSFDEPIIVHRGLLKSLQIGVA